MESSPSFWERLNNWSRRSVTLKLFTMGFLILMMLIPATMVQDLIRERENLRDSAIREVSSKWGLNQTVAGPVISVPYTTTDVGTDGKTFSRSGFAHFLPDLVDVSGKIEPEQRNRGIYVVVLYSTQLEIQGHFGTLNAAALQVPEGDLRWEDALFTIGISDMAGVQNAIQLQLNDTTHNFGPGTVTKDVFNSGASVAINLSERANRMNFAYSLDLNGSSDLFFTPFGKESRVKLEAPWPNPSFEGAFLPDERKVTDDGFMAQWKVLQLNRNYPQQGEGAYINKTSINKRHDSYYNYNGVDEVRQSSNAFGLRLLLPIDEYHKTMRTAKYAALFIFITFLTFFFIEILNRKRLHPIQYILVGGALILFYILLLSIAEHLNFDKAYWISCGITLVLITAYSAFALANRKLSWLIGGLLLLLYGFFYSILQMQDYALLMGSLGLLIMLGTIMYMTRNIDWYQLKK